jgi:2-polyprenyl-6-methoxyphenol hydroxylase-like FAD-dependent oxidoreductase
MTRLGERAVVVGAGMAGLLAARVLTESFDRVTLVERDALRPDPGPRRGVPQSRHPHVLLARGREVLEELFPGLTDELVRYGALAGDLQADGRWYNDGHLLRQHPSGMQALGMTRPLLEDRVRARVVALPTVDLLSPVSVCELMATDGRACGIRVYRGGAAAGVPPGDVLRADLVVDATGRGSHTPAWLESEGFDRPAESTVGVDIRYTTWVLPRRSGDLGGDLGLLIGATVAAPRFGAAIPVEGDRWTVMAGGYRGEVAPPDPAGFRSFAARLAAPDLADLVADRDPVGGPSSYHFVSSSRRHYERLTRFPAGLLVTGDALSSFNPVYGQGMTVAALEALVLREVLDEGPRDLARRFFRRVARLIDSPWDIAAGSDLRLPLVPGPRPLRVRLVNAHVARVQAAASVDPVVGRAFLRVANLVDPPGSLLRPTLVARVLAASRRAAPVRAPVAAG